MDSQVREKDNQPSNPPDTSNTNNDQNYSSPVNEIPDEGTNNDWG